MRVCECTHYEDEHSEGSVCAGCGCTNFREYVKPHEHVWRFLSRDGDFHDVEECVCGAIRSVKL